MNTSYPRRWLALALLAMTQFVVILDASIVNIALPAIGHGLRMSPGGLSWVIDAYLLTFGGLLLLGGRAADLFGRRAVFLAGLLGFTAASLADALAPSGAALIAFRAIQGASAAMMSPAALSIVTNLFAPGDERSRALGVWGAVAGSGSAAGVLLGGVLTNAFGWSSIFLINVPVGVVAAALAPRLIPAIRPASPRHPVDIPGAVLGTAGLSGIVYGLISGSSNGWTAAQTVAALAGGVILLGVFAAVERRSSFPLLSLRVLALRTVASANGVMILIGAAVVSLFFFLSLYMQQVLGYSPLTAGLTQLPLAVILVAAAGAAPVLMRALGRRGTLAAGLILLSGGLGWLVQAPVGGTFLATILGPSLLIGVGMGLAFVPVNAVAVSGVAAEDTGLASGIINTTQQVGGALGLAIATALATARTSAAAHHAAVSLTALNAGYQAGFAAAAAFAAVAAVVSLLAVPRGHQSEGDPQSAGSGLALTAEVPAPDSRGASRE